MGLIAFLLLIIIVGVIVGLAVRYAPMPAEFKTALPVIAIALLVLLLLLYIVGGSSWDVQIPRLR
jgi:nitrogen fixation/metabolism regulation signal transduction histidine kinase